MSSSALTTTSPSPSRRSATAFDSPLQSRTLFHSNMLTFVTLATRTQHHAISPSLKHLKTRFSRVIPPYTAPGTVSRRRWNSTHSQAISSSLPPVKREKKNGAPDKGIQRIYSQTSMNPDLLTAYLQDISLLRNHLYTSSPFLYHLQTRRRLSEQLAMTRAASETTLRFSRRPLMKRKKGSHGSSAPRRPIFLRLVRHHRRRARGIR